MKQKHSTIMQIGIVREVFLTGKIGPAKRLNLIKASVKSIKKTGIYLALFPICLLLCGAQTRGVSVVSSDGKDFHLYKDYHALVVGISNYENWPNLPNAVKESREVAGFFKKMGFKVELITDPTSSELQKALNKFALEKGQEKERALIFYFAGHGETMQMADGKELGYIIPRDCPLKEINPVGFAEKAINMHDIETISRLIKSKHVLMIFDSCFSGSLFYLERAAPTDITEKIARPVRQFITAGGPNEQVPDQSVFKVCLLDGLSGEADLIKDGYITGSELGLYLQTFVPRYTEGGQNPQYGKINNPMLDKGDFVFVTPPTQKLTIESNLPGCDVFLDNKYLGNTPLILDKIAPGRHFLTIIKKPGYKVWNKWVRINPGEEKKIIAVLEKEKPKPPPKVLVPESEYEDKEKIITILEKEKEKIVSPPVVPTVSEYENVKKLVREINNSIRSGNVNKLYEHLRKDNDFYTKEKRIIENFINEIQIINSSFDDVNVNIDEKGDIANVKYLWNIDFKWKAYPYREFKNNSMVLLKMKKNSNKWEIFDAWLGDK